MKLHFIIIATVLILTPLQARTARCTGSFAFGKNTAPASLDVYSTLLTSEQRNPGAVVRVSLTVQPSFNVHDIVTAGGKILRHEGNFVFISCRSVMVNRIAALPGVQRCAVSQLPRPLMDTVRTLCRISQVQGLVSGSLPTAYTGKGVITGILDNEFDTRHPAFLDSTGKTRFLAIWNQNDSTGAKKNRFGYGTIKFKNELIADTAFALTDDSHGTQVANAMAGSDRASNFYGVAPDGILVAVQYGGELEMADGLQWICAVADSLKLPCVINMSIGTSSGPHDGTSPIDRTIDSLSGPGRIIVGAAGNDGAGASHIRFQLAAGTSKSTWIQPVTDSTPKYTICYSAADFWGEPGKSFTGKLLVLNLRTHTYVQSGISFSTSKDRIYGPDTIPMRDSSTGTIDTVIIAAGVEKANSANRRPHLYTYMIAGSSNLHFGLTVTNPGTTTHDIHGWHAYKRYFTGANVDGFENGDSLYTVNEVGGTSKRNITVGGYAGRRFVPLWDGTMYNRDLNPGGIVITSGTGPTLDGRIKPDITAPGWSVITALSRNAPRDRSEVARWPDTTKTTGRYGGETGTSIAAPIVAGIVALMLQIDPALTPEKAKTLLTETAITDELTGPLTDKSNKWGAGKVNAHGAIAKLLGFAVTRAQNERSAKAPSVRFTQGRLRLSSTVAPVALIELFDMQGRTVARIHGSAAPVTILPATIAAGIYSTRIHLADGSAIGQMRIAIVR